MSEYIFVIVEYSALSPKLKKPIAATLSQPRAVQFVEECNQRHIDNFRKNFRIIIVEKV